MKKLILAISAIIITTGISAQNTQTTSPETLTVTEVCIEQDSKGLNPTILEIRWADENGKAGTFRYAAGKWFENKTFENVTNTRVTIPQEISIMLKFKEGGVMEVLLSDEQKLLFEFEAEGTVYPVNVGTGSQFVIRRSRDGKITLLLGETARLSPVPLFEE